MMLPFIEYMSDDNSQCLLAIANAADFNTSSKAINSTTVG